MAKNSSVAETVRQLAEPIAEELGVFIWDVEFVKEGARRVLRITIDSEEGVGIEDCEKLHRAIDPILDEADPIEEQYTLQISSPGIEREIKNDFHLEHCLGETVQVRLYAPLNGFKEYVGPLVSYTADAVTLEVDELVEIPRKAIGKMNIYFEF